MSILKRWDEDYNNNTGIPWSEFVKTVDKSNYSPELFNDNWSGDNDDEDLFSEDDNLYSDEEIANWEKERAGNAKASKDVTFITVHPNGGEGHVIALDDEKKVVSPDAGEFKGTTLSSAKSVGLDELEKKSSEKPSKKVKSKSDDNDDEPAGVEKGTKEYYQAKVDKYEKRLKMYSMKMEELQKKIDSGDSTAASDLEKYKERQKRVEKKLAGYKKNLEKLNPGNEPTIKQSKSLPVNSAETKASGIEANDASKGVEPANARKEAKKDRGSETNLTDDQIRKIESAIAPPDAESWNDVLYQNIEDVNKSIYQWDFMPPSTKEAVNDYVLENYKSFNKALVGSAYIPMSSKKIQKQAEKINSLFMSYYGKTKGDAVLFRAMNGSHLPKDFLNGAPYVDNQLVSTSASHALTHGWRKENKCELAIFLPSGSRAVNISAIGDELEHETLLPPGTVYKYVKTLGYRKADNDKEAHPVYAVVAYTPKKVDMGGAIKKNLEVLENVQKTGKLPSKFQSGVFDIAAQYANKKVDDAYIRANLSDSVEPKQLLAYYEKYKSAYQGGVEPVRGETKDWKAYVKPAKIVGGISIGDRRDLENSDIAEVLTELAESPSNLIASDVESFIQMSIGSDMYKKYFEPVVADAEKKAQKSPGAVPKNYIAKKALERLSRLGLAAPSANKAMNSYAQLNTPSISSTKAQKR